MPSEVVARSTVWLEREGTYLLGQREALLLEAVERVIELLVGIINGVHLVLHGVDAGVGGAELLLDPADRLVGRGEFIADLADDAAGEDGEAGNDDGTHAAFHDCPPDAESYQNAARNGGKCKPAMTICDLQSRRADWTIRSAIAELIIRSQCVFDCTERSS